MSMFDPAVTFWQTNNTSLSSKDVALGSLQFGDNGQRLASRAVQGIADDPLIRAHEQDCLVFTSENKYSSNDCSSATTYGANKQ